MENLRWCDDKESERMTVMELLREPNILIACRYQPGLLPSFYVSQDKGVYSLASCYGRKTGTGSMVPQYSRVSGRHQSSVAISNHRSRVLVSALGKSSSVGGKTCMALR